MRKLLRGLLILLALLALGVAVVYGYVSHTPRQRLALPATLVSLESPEGQTLLTESTARRDYDALLPRLQTQEKISWCGPASATTVLNALHGTRQTQADFFNDCASAVSPYLQVTLGGMPLDTLAAMIACHQAKSEVVHTGDSSLERFRAEAIANLANGGDYLLINYQRASLGQVKGGHISPLGAYHPGSDRFLIVDVAAYKYPPVWVKAADVWAAMDTIDTGSAKLRGYVTVRAQ